CSSDLVGDGWRERGRDGWRERGREGGICFWERNTHRTGRRAGALLCDRKMSVWHVAACGQCDLHGCDMFPRPCFSPWGCEGRGEGGGSVAHPWPILTQLFRGFRSEE